VLSSFISLLRLQRAAAPALLPAQLVQCSPAFIFATAIVLLLGGCASFGKCKTMTCAGDAAWKIDIVPATWITADGREPQSGADANSSRGAYALPSLPPAGQTTGKIDKRELPNFFLSEDRAFEPRAFDWAAAEAPGSRIRIAIGLEKTAPTAAFISVDSQSLSLIRRLDLQQLRELQNAFWADLESQNGCWFFRRCESDFGKDFRADLLSFWQDGVLRDAEVGAFANAQLQSEEGLISYSSTAIPKIAMLKAHTTMVVTPILPEELVAITWGASSLYPPSQERTLADSYSRNVSGGSSLLRVTSNAEGVGLFPRQQCNSNSLPQDKATDQATELFLPYPKEWARLLKELFIPVYNLFDLKSPRLLSSKTDTASLSNCRRDFTYAKHLFLLSPGEYIKADMGGNADSFLQFENEARADSGSNDLKFERNVEQLLARQFLIMGCDSSRLEDVNLEWNRILENAHHDIPKNNVDGAASQPGACGSFVHASFAGRGFVELRESVTVNGQLLEGEAGIPRGESLGEALVTYASLHGVIDLKSRLAKGLELVRRSTSIPDVASLSLRFHAIDAAALDQIVLKQGDRIHADSLPEGIR
jgi:hypothetical protein